FNTRMRQTFGRSDSWGKGLLWQPQIAAHVGPITRSSLIIAAGTVKMPTTIITGTTQYMTAWVILAGTIQLSLAMTQAIALTRLEQSSATMAQVIRLAWRLAQNGSAAVTWTWVTVRQRDTLNACNGSWRQHGSMVAILIRRKRLTLPITRGRVRL